MSAPLGVKFFFAWWWAVLAGHFDWNLARPN